MEKEEEQKEFVDRSFGSLSDEAFAGSSPIHRAMLLCLSKGPIVGQSVLLCNEAVAQKGPILDGVSRSMRDDA